MKVFIEVTSWFKRYTGDRSELELEAAEGTNALQAACSCGIPREEVGFVTVNGVKAEHETLLKNGDKMKVFPLIIGG